MQEKKKILNLIVYIIILFSLILFLLFGRNKIPDLHIELPSSTAAPVQIEGVQ